MTDILFLKVAFQEKLERNNAIIAVLHFTVTVGSSTMSITHTLK
jgi:hypothetical protein